jgi:hypothetical protein
MENTHLSESTETPLVYKKPVESTTTDTPRVARAISRTARTLLRLGTRLLDYPLVEPEVVDWTTARSSFYPVERVVIPLIRIEQFVRLRKAPSRVSQSQK